MYGSSCMFRHYIAILRERSRVFWEMLNWGAVDKNIVDGRVVSGGVVQLAPCQIEWVIGAFVGFHAYIILT
jgi:hypothetical protein